MDFAELLSSKEFTRTKLPLSEPIVIHAIAGAGKTHLLEQYSRHNPSNTFFTPLDNKSNSLLLSPFSSDCSSASFIDEYPLCEIPPSAKYLLADPIQYLGNPNLRKPHYICPVSHRFGSQTAALLSSLGIEAYSRKQDIVVSEDIFSFEPEGQVIACDPETQALARRHSLDFLRPCESIGRTFHTTTVLISDKLTPETLTKEIYIGLTRHTSKLIILSPHAATAST
ncbi:P2 [Citrus yellow mottle-associated virus]|uniref:P2 n=1 Tax=Citrus yellow mottle-associated virus TaxID=2843960 RepID=A0A650F1D9_9VIRU|nr:P2 [Citrus yellow mottle virus]QGT76799.1 P2 [Citrus yellow mottle virus]